MKTAKGELNPEGGPLGPPSPRPPSHQGGVRLSCDKAVATLPWGGSGQGLGKGARAGRREGSGGAGGAWARGRPRALTSGQRAQNSPTATPAFMRADRRGARWEHLLLCCVSGWSACAWCLCVPSAWHVSSLTSSFRSLNKYLRSTHHVPGTESPRE